MVQDRHTGSLSSRPTLYRIPWHNIVAMATRRDVCLKRIRYIHEQYVYGCLLARVTKWNFPIQGILPLNTRSLGRNKRGWRLLSCPALKLPNLVDWCWKWNIGSSPAKHFIHRSSQNGLENTIMKNLDNPLCILQRFKTWKGMYFMEDLHSRPHLSLYAERFSHQSSHLPSPTVFRARGQYVGRYAKYPKDRAISLPKTSRNLWSSRIKGKQR